MATDHCQFNEVDGEIDLAFKANMQSPNLWINLQSQSQPPSRTRLAHRRPFEETDSEDELVDIDPLPPALQNPRQRSTPEVEPAKPQHHHNNTLAERESTPFIPAGDMPKYRRTNHRFKPIVPKGDEEDVMKDIDVKNPALIQHNRRGSKPSRSRMYSLSVAESADEAQETKSASASSRSRPKAARACPTCRKHRQRCSHKQGVTTPLPAFGVSTASVPLKESKPIINTAGKLKRDGTPYQRNLHSGSKGLSMKHNAVDYRQRRDVQKEYLARLARLLDADIVKQVEAEGGITPEGRTFKAAVRMLERVVDERAGRCKNEPKQACGSASPESKYVSDDIETLQKRALQAEEKLAALKQALQDIMVD